MESLIQLPVDPQTITPPIRADWDDMDKEPGDAQERRDREAREAEERAREHERSGRKDRDPPPPDWGGGNPSQDS